MGTQPWNSRKITKDLCNYFVNGCGCFLYHHHVATKMAQYKITTMIPQRSENTRRWVKLLQKDTKLDIWVLLEKDYGKKKYEAMVVAPKHMTNESDQWFCEKGGISSVPQFSWTSQTQILLNRWSPGGTPQRASHEQRASRSTSCLWDCFGSTCVVSGQWLQTSFLTGNWFSYVSFARTAVYPTHEHVQTWGEWKN